MVLPEYLHPAFNNLNAIFYSPEEGEEGKENLNSFFNPKNVLNTIRSYKVNTFINCLKWMTFF